MHRPRLLRAGANSGSMRKALRKMVIAPGPQRPSALSSSQPTSTRTRPRLLWTATAFGWRSKRFLIVGGCCFPIAFVLPGSCRTTRVARVKLAQKSLGYCSANAPQEPDPVPAGELQPFAERQQQRRLLLGDRRRPGQFGQSRRRPPRWPGRVPRSAPGVRVGAARHPQGPFPRSALGATDRPVV